MDNDSDNGLEEEDEFGQWTIDNDSDNGLEEEEFGIFPVLPSSAEKMKRSPYCNHH